MRISREKLNKSAPRRGLLRRRVAATEFEVQAFLYHELRAMGYRVRGEIPVFGCKARFDLAIYEDDDEKLPIRIIEVKPGLRSGNPETACGSQIDRYYTEFGVPVDLVCGMGDAKKYVSIANSILSAT